MKITLKRFLISSPELTATHTKFGISYEGALAFAIGETNKEFKKNKLNKFIDYSLLKNSIVNNLENNCQVYDFDISTLENLKFRLENV